MRVLHLIDSHAGWPALHAASVLHAREPASHCVALFGAPELIDLAVELGVTVDRLPVRCTGATFARYLSHRETPSIIHAWSIPTLITARNISPSTPRVLSLWSRPSAMNALVRRRAARALATCRRILATNPAVTEAWSRALASTISAELLTLPVDPTRFHPGFRQSIRDQWGVTDDTTVIAAIGDPSHSVDARLIGYQAGVLSIAGRRSAAVTPSNGRDVERARRFRGHHKDREWEVIIEDRPLWHWLAACDACVWTDDSALQAGNRLNRIPPSPLGLTWAAAAGVPVIADNSPLVHELLGPDAATYVAPGKRLDLNRGLLRVIDDQPWRTARTTAARSAVAGMTPDAFDHAMQEIYAGASTA